MINLLSTLTDWRTSLRRTFGRVLQHHIAHVVTHVSGNTGWWSTLADEWNAMIKAQISQIVAQQLPFVEFHQIIQHTLRSMLFHYKISLLDEEFDSLVHAWERARLWVVACSL